MSKPRSKAPAATPAAPPVVPPMAHCRKHPEYTSGCVACYGKEYARQERRPGPLLEVVAADLRAKSITGDLLRVEDGEDGLPWAELNIDDHSSGVLVFGGNQAECDFRADFITKAVNRLIERKTQKKARQRRARRRAR